MLALAALVLPVFGLIGVGFLARATNYINDRAGDGLSDFVFSIAIPCLIFRTLSGAALPPTQPWGYWISYFTGSFIVWGLAMVGARRFFRVEHDAAVIAGFSAAQANTVMIGIPMILAAFGEEGATPLFLLIAVHLPIMIVVATLLIEGRDAHILRVLTRLARNPIILAILAGGAARLVGYAPSGLFKTILDMLAQTGAPCALFAMGVALHRYGFVGGLGLPAMISALKLIAHPLIVFLLARHVFTMPPAWAGVAVLFAACPCGVNAYLFAERYGTGAGVSSSAVSLSTALAVATTMFWLWALGVHIG